MIKLVASDVDGTLVPDGTFEIDPEIYDVIKKLKERVLPLWQQVADSMRALRSYLRRLQTGYCISRIMADLSEEVRVKHGSNVRWRKT